MILNTTKYSLTVFFMLLSLSIGMVSIHSPLNIHAQNSALSQSGNSDSEQETKQLQSSGQNDQVVSGDSSIISGNNILCQNQENSRALQGLTGICNFDESSPPSSGETATLNLTISVGSDFCEIRSCSFLVEYGGTERIQREITSDTSELFNIPVGVNFAVIVHSNQFVHLRGDVIANSDCAIMSASGELFFCTGVKNSQPTEVFVAIDRSP